MSYVERKRWVFFGLPFSFTVYTVGEEYITINSGFFTKREDDCYMYKVTDVRLESTFMERIFGLGSVKCITSDSTDPDLQLHHIKNAKEIKNYILEKSEAQRMKRRTVNTQNITGHLEMDLDNDGIPDELE